MSRRAIFAVPTAAVLLFTAFAGPAPFERSPQEFSKLLDTADRAFNRKDYLTSVQNLQQSITIANAMLREAMLQVMPLPPQGFVEVAREEPRVDPHDPIGSAMAMSANRPIDVQFRRRDGQGFVRVLVVPNSPAATSTARAISIAEQNPANPVLKLGRHVGLLEKSVADLTMRFVVNEVHFVEVRASGIEEDELLKRIDVAFLDRVAKTLGG